MQSETFELAIIGGGLAGVTAAVSAARIGVKTALVQNRPVLGGNSSSEIRVPVGGACDFNPWARESGILEEFFLQERAQDPRRIWLGVTPSLWDITLFDLVKREENITLFLNTEVYDTVTTASGRKIEAVRCRTISSEHNFTLKAGIFIDATGDGTIAFMAGAGYRTGREGKEEFNEALAPDIADNKAMGSSLLFHAEDAGQPVPFIPPEWVEIYEHDEDLLQRTHDDISAGYWWIEVGNPPFDTIKDNEQIRDELYRQLLGVWDHIKNRGEHGAENLHIDFIGSVPGKRESRRITGDYIMREQDILADTGFHDAVAYGGWFCDLHAMGGILNKSELPEPSFAHDMDEVDKRQTVIYSIPLRSLYSRDIDNLMMAGRDISATHVAHGSARLMATCAVIGQASGTAAAFCIKEQALPREISKHYIEEVQTQLLKDDCYIPGKRNTDTADLAREAHITVSSHAKLEFPSGTIGHEFEHPKQKSFSRSNLDAERAQLFPCSTGTLNAIALQIRSDAECERELSVALFTAGNTLDFKSGSSLFSTKTVVPPGFRGYLEIPCNIQTEPDSLLFVTAKSSEDVFWMYSPHAPTGTVSATRIIRNWKLQKGVYGMQITPDSFPYQEKNLLSGVTRPEKWTNIWISDPHRNETAWVQYRLAEPKPVNTVHLTFDTNLQLAHMGVPGLYRAPECVRDYRLLGLTDNSGWQLLAEETGNFQRKRIHHFGTMNLSALKLEVLQTNGDPSARLYELRAYNET